MNNDITKTAGWLRREGATGTDEEMEEYARNWLAIREQTGIALNPERGPMPMSNWSSCAKSTHG